MSIELKAYVEQREVGLEEALKAKGNVRIDVVGKNISIERLRFYGVNIVDDDTYTITCSFSAANTFEDIFGNPVNNKYNKPYAVTGRSYLSYKKNAKSEYGLDLDRLVEEGVNEKWLEVGPGISEFIPKLALRQKESGGPRPTIVEPLDYESLAEAVSILSRLQTSIKIDGLDPEEILRRISILTNSDLVERIPKYFHELPQDRISSLQGKFFVVLDSWGPHFSKLYGLDYKNAYSKLTKNKGHVIIL